MIFITVGTQKFQLNRLLSQVDELVSQGRIKEKVFAQIGHSEYEPRNYDYVNFMSRKEFEKRVNECSLLITHSGVGTIITGISRKKPIIVFPRLKKYGEHVDDHQVQIAKSFEELNYVFMCGEKDSLCDLIKKSQNHQFAVYRSQREEVVSFIRDYLASESVKSSH